MVWRRKICLLGRSERTFSTATLDRLNAASQTSRSRGAGCCGNTWDEPASLLIATSSLASRT